MDNENKLILPDIPEGKDLIQSIPDFLKDDEWADTSVDDDWLDPTEEYESPDWTLSYDGAPLAPLGGIHSLTGQPGHGKTMTFTQIIVAILKGSYGLLKYELGEKVPKPRVLYIDTEMEKANTQLVNLRIYTAMGWSYGVPHEELKILMLRETENAADRWKKILKAIYLVKPTVCFIDGLLDVVSDFNENTECQLIIYKCMKVASHYKISLWCLVHENPGGSKMVGHLGSMLERKVTDSLCTLKTKDEVTGDVKFTVKQKKARGKDLKDWKFIVSDEVSKFGIPTPIENDINGGTFNVDIDKLKDWLITCSEMGISEPFTLKDAKIALKGVSGITNNDNLQQLIISAKKSKFITPQPKDEKVKGQTYDRFYFNKDILRPEEAPF